MKIDWKLKGLNLLKFNCNKDTVIHPETCSDMVQMEHDGTLNLTDWIKSGTSSIGDNLADWITNNLSGSITVNSDWHPNGDLDQSNALSLGYIGSASSNPIKVSYSNSLGVSTPTYGVVCAGPTVETNQGVLNIKAATTSTLGGIRLGTAPQTMTTTRPVLMGLTGPAYVVLDNINANTYLYNWQINLNTQGTKMASTFWINPNGDNNPDPKGWEGDTLTIALTSYPYFTNIKTRYDGVTSIGDVIKRVYPIRADKDGRLYDYIDLSYSISRETNTNNIQLKEHFSDAGTVISTVDFTPKDGVTHNGNTTAGCLAKFSAAGTVTNGPALGSGTTTYLRNDGTWHTPDPYELANVSNPTGLLSVSESYPNTVGCNVVEPGENPTTVIPIRCDDDNKIHVVVLDDIVKAIVKNEDFINTFAAALAIPISVVVKDDSETNDSWKSALGLS